MTLVERSDRSASCLKHAQVSVADLVQKQFKVITKLLVLIYFHARIDLDFYLTDQFSTLGKNQQYWMQVIKNLLLPL